MGFLDDVFGGKDKGKKSGGGGGSGGGMQNPFANIGGQKKFQGQGQSLGGKEQGTVLSITLPNPGPVGIRVSLTEHVSDDVILDMQDISKCLIAMIFCISLYYFFIV